jgi:hypothetical protein
MEWNVDVLCFVTSDEESASKKSQRQRTPHFVETPKREESANAVLGIQNPNHPTLPLLLLQSAKLHYT